MTPNCFRSFFFTAQCKLDVRAGRQIEGKKITAEFDRIFGAHQPS